MGMTVCGTVTYAKPLVDSLASMPTVVIAFSQAVIDKTYLTWLDVSKLLIAFPEPVQVLGDTVTFQGPVAIISSVTPEYRYYAQCVLGIITFCVFKKKISKQGDDMIDSIASSILSLIGAGCAFYVAGRHLPTQAGVHFFS
jgi:hypothetical protein